MKHLWPIIQEHIRAQVDERTWERFFQHLEPTLMEAGTIYFELPDEFFVTWFENNYKGYLTEVAETVGDGPVELHFFPRGQSPDPASDTASGAQEGPQPPPPPGPHAPWPAPPQGYPYPAQGYPPQHGGYYPQAHGQRAPQQGSPQGYPFQQQQQQQPHQAAMFSQAAHASAAYPHAPAYPAPPTNGGPPGMARAYPAATSLEERILRAGLNPRYTFDNYVVGPSNQFSNAACMAVGERPAQAYNPLFLYGGVGLGKTHLLHAVGIEILRRFPSTRITYVTSENFMNGLIHSLRTKDMNSFRSRYRDECDVLLMDDIQFIAGKNSTQEEFFHTFNALHQAHKQIVITSDKMPQELPGLEERLRSRFAWGLIADVQPPEIETRVAIIKKKAEVEAIHLGDDVAMFLATHIRSNVRELEGSLIKLKASASLFHKEVTIDFAKEQLRGVIQERNQHITIERIQKLTANYYNVKVKDLTGKRRHRVVSHPRHVAMYLSRKHTSHSYPEIGKNFGGRDHSTVMNAVSKIEGLLEDDEDLKGEVSSLERSMMR